ncbi:MAG: beta-ketoacyl synthase chain length factor [Thermodesulfobacteriota bacterium]
MSCLVTGVNATRLDELVISPTLEGQLRRADEFIRLAMGCVHEKFAETLATGDELRSGLIVGTAFGPMQTNFEVLDLVVSGQQSSPTLFSHSVYNGAAGYLARSFSLKAMSITLTDFGFPFFHALQQAKMAIDSNILDRCLVLQVDSYSTLLDDIRKQCGLEYERPWLPGCVCWLLESSDCSDSGWSLDKIEAQTIALGGEKYLDRRDTVRLNGDEQLLTDPLGSAQLLTGQLLVPDPQDEIEFTLTAPYGDVAVTLSSNPQLQG